MKLRLTFKTPDAVRNAMDQALWDSQDEEARLEAKMRMAEVCRRWVRFDEYITVEIDTEAGTARVLEVGR